MKLPEGILDVVAIGETLVDFISEEETDTLRDATKFRKYLGGSPANIVTNVAKLGCRSAIISKTGIGNFGQFLKAELQRCGVNTDYMIMDHRVHTSFVFIARTSGTPDFEASRNGDYKLEPREVSTEAITSARVVHASTFALSREPCRAAVQHAFRLARDQSKIISFDPNYSPAIWPDRREALQVLRNSLAMADLTKPSLDDAHRIWDDHAQPEDYIERFHEMGPRAVVFTMGSEGILLSEEGDITYVSARPVKVVDVTGAGDSFWAAFLVALLDGNSLYRCALFAREIVEIKLTTVGPLPDNLDRRSVYAELGTS
jgi:sugar/nucleoside kinase (ribokinase family)